MAISGGSETRKFLVALTFLLPSLVALLVFVFGPMLASLWFSLNRWNILSPMEYVGLSNFQRLFSDRLWWASLVNTVVYSVLNIPLVIAVSILFALIVNKKAARGRTLFKVVYFMPVVVSEVAISVVWRWVLSTNYGILNAALNAVGLPAFGWLTTSRLALLSVVGVVVWRWAGYYMVIMMAALNEVPNELYETASIDGVGTIRQFIYITLPFMKPVMFFVAVMCTLGSFQMFDIIYMMTQGGPGSSTYLTGFYLYQTAFTHLRMGYGSSMAAVLFVILLGITVFQMKFSKSSLSGVY